MVTFTNNDRLNILLIEDDAEDVLLVKKILGRVGGGSLHLECSDRFEAGLERLQKGGLDIVLLDLFLPDSEGFHALESVRSQVPSIPIVVLTSLDDESTALEAVSNGAQDYLVKGEINSPFFLRTIRHAIERQRIRIELDETNARLQQLVLLDPLTGLLNRRGLQQILSGQMQRASRKADLLGLLIDLDDFKQVNDTLGHAVGDVVLNEITRRLKTSLRATDYAARIGGDEFALLLPETRMAEGVRVAEKVRLAISGSPLVLSSEKPIKVTASLGLAAVPPATSSIDELLIATRVALAKSKRGGKNRVSYDARQNKGDKDVDNDLRDIRNELCEGKIQVLKHSIYSLFDLKRVGYEFLSRSTIDHFEMPDDFFRISLENNILTLVDHRCFKACAAAAASTLANGMRCHLNLFPSTLIDVPAQHLLEELRNDHGDVTYCIEISEQQIIGDPSYLVKPAEEIKQAGVLVAIDDLGFGRSCFESLILLEPDIIKIDKACVIGVAMDEGRARSLKRILNVAQALNTEVVAEGIEAEGDLAVLKDLGVRYGQGFLFDKPISAYESIPAG